MVVALDSLAPEIVDHILSALQLHQLLCARLTGRLLHDRVQRRFLPVIPPPDLAGVELSIDEHGPHLVRLFASYLGWLRRWRETCFRAHPPRRPPKRPLQRQLRNQCTVIDGYFSLAPWWREFGEVVPAQWQPEKWLQDAVFMAPDPEDTDEVLCQVCSNASGSDASLLLCDNCGCGVHMECMQPPLSAIPEGLWLCPQCRSGEGARP
jgi:hypothetical protein